MQKNNLPALIKYPTQVQYIGAGLILFSPILFFLTLPPSYIDFFLFIALIFLGASLLPLGHSGKRIFPLLKKENIFFKEYKFLKNRVFFQYKSKEFEIVPFLRYSLHGYLRRFDHRLGAPDEPHMEIWTKITATVPCIEDPYKKILRILRKPDTYIQENIKEYGGNISDLLFLGFTKRDNDTYLLAMLDVDTTAYILTKMLDIMSEIVERYEKE
jgi:hypothetical protein